MLEKHFKNFLDSIQALQLVLLDVIDESILPIDKLDTIKNMLEELLQEIRKDKPNKDVLKKHFIKLYKLATYYKVFIDEDEREFIDQILDERKLKKIESILDIIFNRLDIPKIKNTVEAVIHELLIEFRNSGSGERDGLH